MKMRCHVDRIENQGDRIEVRVIGKADNEAEWMAQRFQTFSVADTARNRRSFWIGRNVDIEITPR
jgi:hypothetical protein